jgi:hypothetical protein
VSSEHFPLSNPLMSYFLRGIPKLALGHHKKHFGANKLLPKKKLKSIFLKENFSI